MDLYRDDPSPRMWEQVTVIRQFFDVAVGARPGSPTTPDYLAEQGYLLVREGAGNEDLVGRNVAVRQTGAEPERAYGVVKLPVHGDVRDAIRSLHLVPEIRDAVPQIVSLNHLVTIAPVNACPADEPTLPPPPSEAGSNQSRLVPPLAGGNAGAGAEVLVVDTGLLEDFQLHPWLGGVVGGPNQPAPEGVILQYMGHGTFIAGLLRCMAPAANITVSNELLRAGSIPEFELGGKLLDAVGKWQQSLTPPATRWPDIIVLSAGATTHNDRPLMGLEAFVQQLRTHSETTLVAAACNDGVTKPAWPAALAGNFPEPVPGVVSVGALRADRKGRACFSNYGDWVSVFVRGERLVNAFTHGSYTNVHGPTLVCRYYREPPHLYPACACVTAGHHGDFVPFEGLAQWSGTSFATPVVAGRIAAAMRAADGTHRSSFEAFNHLLRTSMQPIKDDSDGVVLPVLEEPYYPTA